MHLRIMAACSVLLVNCGPAFGAPVDAIRAAMPGLIAQMPSSVELKLRNDRSVSIRAAIHDVQITLAITITLVLLVIFLFLRKASATFIPALSLPISLLGTVALMRVETNVSAAA